MSGTGILGISTSALLAYQQALQTTSNNISNANTPGYARERVDLSAAASQPAGGYYIGSGVQTTGVQRIVNQYVNKGVTEATSANSRYQTASQYSQQVDNLLADQSAGLQPALQSFFNAVQGVANAPTSISARQELISQGGTLAGRFNTLYQQLNNIHGQINGQLGNEVSSINSLASQIANLNKQIISQQSSNVDGQPNSLLDQRDALINQLAQDVSVHTVTQSDGAMNVMIGTGQALVVGTSTTQLGVANLSGDPQQLGLVFKTSAGNVPVSNVVTGGKLGGLLDAYNQTLVPALNSLGRLAIGIASQVNAQQAKGIDLTGAVGGAFFNVPQPNVYSAPTNTGTGKPQVSIGNVANLTTSDYQLSYDGTSWSLRNTSTGQSVAMTGAGTTASPYQAAGLNIVVPSGAAKGDSFTIEPTRNAARDISMAATDPRQIAAAAPMASAATKTNTGTATISAPTAGTLINATLSTLQQPVTITIGSNGTTWTAANTKTGAPVGNGGTYNATANGSTPAGATVSINGWSVNISGGAKPGDTFTVFPTGPGDNQNALKLAAIQQNTFLEGGTATLGGAYGQLVANVGSTTQAAKNNATTQQGLLNQATALQQSVSGVNLDQEASNLLKFEQAYQASAKVISTASSLFQSLLNAVQ